MLSTLLLAASTAAGSTGSPLAATLVFKNGKIWTVDAALPEAQAVAVWRDRIVFVGSDADVAALIGPQTRTIDLHGRRVVPGFYDSHAHVLMGGRLLAQVNLKDAKDEAEFGALLKKFDGNLPRDRWILGGNWDHDRTFNGKLPTAAILDRHVPNRPIFIRRYDGHMGVANSRALELAGINAMTKDPAGGVIERRADGAPSGVLKDNAMDLIARAIPAFNEEETIESLRAALQEARRLGVTSMQDLDGDGRAGRQKLFRAYQELARRGELTCRIDLRWPIGAQKELTDAAMQTGFGNDFIRVGGVKGFMDGSLGSSTAKMFEPYVAGDDNTGIFVTPPDAMAKLIASADAARLSVAVHAIGDRANAELLELFAAAAQANGPRDRRFRVEHAQHLRPQDFARFKTLNVVASMQPYHLIDDGRWAEGRIGAKRCSTSYANRAMLDAGVKLAFGSDWPVAPLDPIPGIDAAVNRRTLDGKHPGGWFPEQKITVNEAIEAYTLTSAYAGFEEKERGSIATGKFADLVVLSRDILDPKEVDRIAGTHVVLTVVGGKCVFEK